MAKIQKIWAREILDSKATPTVEAACQLDNGVVAVASIPSGAATSAHEAVELRDNDTARYRGKGVLKAVNNINQAIGPSLVTKGFDATDQTSIDNFMIQMDGTENRSRLGANSMLAVSTAVCKAASMTQRVPIYKWVQSLAQAKGMNSQLSVPTALFNMINGGLHGAGNLDFQEFLVIPASSKQFSEGLRMGVEIYMLIGENLAHRGAIHSVGDEGGYAPNLFTNADALEVLVEAIRSTSYQIGRDVFLGLDVAANTFYENNVYTIRDKSSPLNEDLLIEYYKELNGMYHLAILEDPLHEDAWQGWKKLRATLGNQATILGDDLLATNPKRVQKAIQDGICNGILVKPNQIGTISETIDIVKLARDSGWKVVVSHRSGETNDSFIAEFAVGVGSDYVKFGAPARGERVSKYNRLSSIEVELTLEQNAS